MKEMTLRAVLDNIPKITAFIDSELEALDCPLKAQMQIDMAIDELFGNIAHYAYGDKVGDATVRFEFDPSTREASITFMDSGVAFDPLQRTDPDTTLSAEERQIGGLGIFLVRKTMDMMNYHRKNGMNMLTIIKKI